MMKTLSKNTLFATARILSSELKWESRLSRVQKEYQMSGEHACLKDQEDVDICKGPTHSFVTSYLV